MKMLRLILSTFSILLALLFLGATQVENLTHHHLEHEQDLDHDHEEEDCSLCKWEVAHFTWSPPSLNISSPLVQIEHTSFALQSSPTTPILFSTGLAPPMDVI